MAYLKILAIFVAAWLVTALTGSTSAQYKETEAPDHVTVKAVAGKPDKKGTQEVLVTLELDSRVRIYANPIGHDDFKTSELTVKFLIGGKPAEATINYPPGLKKREASIEIHYYRGVVKIPCVVHRQPGDVRPLEVVVRPRGWLEPAYV